MRLVSLGYKPLPIATMIFSDLIALIFFKMMFVTCPENLLMERLLGFIDKTGRQEGFGVGEPLIFCVSLAFPELGHHISAAKHF